MKSIKFLWFLVAALIGALFNQNASGAHINATWIGGIGEPEGWSSSTGERGNDEDPYRTNWTGAVIPGENSEHTYSVFIDGGKATEAEVLWTGRGHRVRDLILDSGDSLIARPSGSLAYNAQIKFGASGAAHAANFNGDFSMTAGNSFQWGSGLYVYFYGDFTFGGSGTMTGSGTANLIQGGSTATSLTLGPGLTVQGSMDINCGDLPLTVASTVDANHPEGRSLSLQTNPDVPMRVTSALYASDGGRLAIGGGDLDLSGGSLTAEADSKISLVDGLEVSGGTFFSSGTGYLETSYGYYADNHVTLDGVTLAGDLLVQGSTSLILANSNTLNGILDVRYGTSTASSRYARVVADGNVSLEGSGTIRLNRRDYSVITGNGSENSLTLSSTIRVEGQGDIGGNDLVLHNAGTIDANADNQSITLDIPEGKTWTNTGTIKTSLGAEDSDPGRIYIGGAGVLENDGGTIRAVNDSRLSLSGVTVEGGLIVGETGSNVSLQGTLRNVTLEGQMEVTSGGTLYASGRLTNEGILDIVYRNGDSSRLYLSGDLVLDGSGTTSVAGYYDRGSSIRAAEGTDYLLTISSGHTVTGSGFLGDSRIKINNQGVITSSDGNTLRVDPKDGSPVINTGTFRADNNMLICERDLDSSGGRVESINGARLIIRNDLTLDSSSTVLIELNDSTAYLDVSGATTLAGTLELILGEGYVPALGDALTIIKTGEYTGEFNSVLLPTMPEGLFWEVGFSGNDLVATVVEGNTGDDHGDSLEEATAVALGGSESGHLDEGDMDYFKVEVMGPGTLTVYSEGSTDTHGSLLDGSGSLLADNDDGEYDLNFWIGYSIQSAGSYYVKVRAYDSETSGDYSFACSFTPSDSGTDSWHSDAVDMGDGWRWFSWLGSFNVSQDPWIYHAQHGWLYSFADGPESVYFWDTKMESILWTSENVYPSIYRFSDGQWIFYQKGSKNPRWFVDLLTKLWEQW